MRLVSCSVLAVGVCQDLFLGRLAEPPREPSARVGFGGISKNTWAATDPVQCAEWFLKYIPGTEYEGNECPDNVCPCATEGRVHMPNATGKGDTFGVHAVNCIYHPDGACSLKDVEAGWKQRFGDLKEYTPLMDHNLGLWAHSLGQVLDTFDADSILYLPMRWEDDGKPYYSALVNPCGNALIEFISDDIGSRPPNAFRRANSRMQFREWNGPHGPTEGNPLGLYPLKISRPTTKLDAVVDFYTDVFKTTVLHNESFDDGARVVTLKFPDTSSGPTLEHLQLWSRPEEPAVGEGCDEWTVAKWEQYQLEVHASEMRGLSCGMDRWLDNHFAFDCDDEQQCDVADYLEGFERHGVKVRADPKGANGPWYMYAFDPSGAGVELHFGYWSSPVPGVFEATPPSCIHGSFENGTCAGQEPGQCT